MQAVFLKVKRITRILDFLSEVEILKDNLPSPNRYKFLRLLVASPAEEAIFETFEAEVLTEPTL